MSYAMRWILRVQPEPGELRDLTAELSWPSSSSAPELRELLGIGRGRGRIHTGAVWSWYEAESDMRELSSRFPTLVFILDVHNADEPGLYPPERWYFYGGKMQKVIAEVVFADLAASKLA